MTSLSPAAAAFVSLRGRRLKGKGKGVLGARETRGARKEGGRETPARRPLFFFVFNIHQVNVKILIGPSSKHVNHSLNTLIRLAEINITLLSSPISFPFKRLPCRLQHLLVCPMILTSCVTKMLRGGGFQPPFHVPWWGYEFLCMPGD